MSEEFTSCKEALMQVLEEIERVQTPGKTPDLMHSSVNWRSRTIRFEPAGYEINLSLIRDEGEVLEWVKHLSEKNWITVKLLTEFIEAATNDLLWMRARKMA
jgi:hypothetical protein